MRISARQSPIWKYWYTDFLVMGSTRMAAKTAALPKTVTTQTAAIATASDTSSAKAPELRYRDSTC